MNKSKHVAIPIFCAGCVQKMLDNLPVGRSEHAAYCEHFNTLAQVSIEPAGIIRAWRLRGPLSEEQAALMIEIGAGMRAEIFAREKTRKKTH